jgi:hypothetical protein
MAWVRFARDFDFSPAKHGGRVTIAYLAGTTRNVTRECADLAVSSGAAEPAQKEAQDARRR